MAVKLMMSSYGGGDDFLVIAAGKIEDKALRKAASAGIHGMEEFPKLIGQSQPTEENQTEITAVTDIAVNSFKKMISLLGRSRIGHARFRQAPATMQTPFKQTTVEEEEAEEKKPVTNSVFTRYKTEQHHGGSAFRVYYPTPIHRRPPLAHNNNNNSQNQSKNGSSSSSPPMLSNGAPSTINFAPSPPVSGTNSFMSSHRYDDTDNTHMSSGFEFTNPSHISGSRAKPRLSFYSSDSSYYSIRMLLF